MRRQLLTADSLAAATRTAADSTVQPAAASATCATRPAGRTLDCRRAAGLSARLAVVRRRPIELLAAPPQGQGGRSSASRAARTTKERTQATRAPWLSLCTPASPSRGAGDLRLFASGTTLRRSSEPRRSLLCTRTARPDAPRRRPSSIRRLCRSRRHPRPRRISANFRLRHRWPAPSGSKGHKTTTSPRLSTLPHPRANPAGPEAYLQATTPVRSWRTCLNCISRAVETHQTLDRPQDSTCRRRMARRP